MPQFIRKHKAVEAMQLSEANLDKVTEWSGGKICATYNPKVSQIIISQITGKDCSKVIAYARYGWWLLNSVDGFEVMSHEHFTRDYQVI